MDAALSQIYWDRDSRKSIEFARRALNSKALSVAGRVNALFALGTSQFQLNETDAAIGPLEELVTLRCFAEDSVVLGICHSRTGDTGKAIEALRRAAAISPSRRDIQELLADLYERDHESRLAAFHRNRARQLPATQPSPRAETPADFRGSPNR